MNIYHGFLYVKYKTINIVYASSIYSYTGAVPTNYCCCIWCILNVDVLMTEDVLMSPVQKPQHSCKSVCFYTAVVLSGIGQQCLLLYYNTNNMYVCVGTQ